MMHSKMIMIIIHSIKSTITIYAADFDIKMFVMA